MLECGWIREASQPSQVKEVAKYCFCVLLGQILLLCTAAVALPPSPPTSVATVSLMMVMRPACPVYPSRGRGLRHSGDDQAHLVIAQQHGAGWTGLGLPRS